LFTPHTTRLPFPPSLQAGPDRSQPYLEWASRHAPPPNILEYVPDLGLYKTAPPQGAGDGSAAASGNVISDVGAWHALRHDVRQAHDPPPLAPLQPAALLAASDTRLGAVGAAVTRKVGWGGWWGVWSKWLVCVGCGVWGVGGWLWVVGGWGGWSKWMVRGMWGVGGYVGVGVYVVGGGGRYKG
jgi:hypothetical protein